MSMWTLAEACQALQQRGVAAELVGNGAIAFARVHTDTRSLQAGDLFVALKGERFDAHDFLPQAAATGAVAALAERGLDGLNGIQVSDTRVALAELAGAWRARQSLPLIAVTGSNGKTTVTQMIASILRAWQGEAGFLATAGNFNNDIGVPLTLLRLDAEHGHHAAVVEIGMNHPGEIAPLARLAAPTVALVNNAQREHQEFMATVEATARENGAVLQALPPTGVAVFPADDPCAPIWFELAGSRPHLSFALQGEADVRADAQWLGTHWAVQMHTPAGELPVVLALPGVHNLRNALAACACALAAGAPLAAIQKGLEGFQAAKGRSALSTLRLDGRALTLVDDSYNANPDSMRAAIELLAGLEGPRWLLMGDMGEVGDQGPAFHAEVGELARERGIEHLWCAGSAVQHAAAAYGAAARVFSDSAALAAAIANEHPPARSVLAKGSRFTRMELAVAALRALEETPGRSQVSSPPPGGLTQSVRSGGPSSEEGAA
ncbi:UDP-N-acetylmuramoyl-tripeptide--D-alanyl-D-alanine ligase [Inhella inkyongensis]|uniref:UDP-N-acetylmuramoyl-tripeptide--D-alanyl-D-alanine ligase n=1 Tax=Inhella inkyongensis TaxID=392593 RepID=A0A840S3N6_9BURK|nr:UDP-N-acetylmuramoyl-tripeptide--D-alanyl-D-alanine ligase [Inhella inkyongensis]MBB5203444.1 UDP-N-acetylmuramoyl-tripeptide--D-alanyl-D-alanine ligase [Inhella inkyongensis]